MGIRGGDGFGEGGNGLLALLESGLQFNDFILIDELASLAFHALVSLAMHWLHLQMGCPSFVLAAQFHW
jgi:hypothetical protein